MKPRLPQPTLALPRSSKPLLTLSSEQRAELQRATHAGAAAQRLVSRAKLVLLLAEGHSEAEGARRAGTCRATVARWRDRYEAGGFAVLDRDELINVK